MECYFKGKESPILVYKLMSATFLRSHEEISSLNGDIWNVLPELFVLAQIKFIGHLTDK